MTQTAATTQTPLLHSIYGYIQDGKIYAQTYEGTQQVGVTYHIHNELLKQHNDLTEICENYKKRLVELGEIEIPLTQEQIIEQQARQLKETQALMVKLSAKIDELTTTKESDNEPHAAIQGRGRTEQESSGNDDGGVPDSPGDTAKPRRPPQSHKSK